MSSFLAKLGLGGASAGDCASNARHRRRQHVESLPLYSPIAPSESSPDRLDNVDDDDDYDTGSDVAAGLHQAQRRGGRNQETTTAAGTASTSPFTPRFWADFTLGFADGLTVPFALTAGLSSLGETDTVIYAGMAEICAGSISMGIGGYLSARGENKAAAAASAAAATAVADSSAERAKSEGQNRGRGQKWERLHGLEEKVDDQDKTLPSHEQLVSNYLAPLDLPPHLIDLVLGHAQGRPEVHEALLLKEKEEAYGSATARGGGRDGSGDDDDDDDESERPPSPLFVGLSVSLGYLLGGLLPLFPYFFVGEVGDGLLWSFMVCAVALFVFGFCKDFAFARSNAGDGSQNADALDPEMGAGRGRFVGLGRPMGKIPWADIRRSAWEGTQMVFLGSTAALAAVLCVRLFEGAKA